MIAESTNDVPEFALIVSEKGGKENRSAFRAGELTVGRVAGNDLVLPKGNVSKRHARILYREGRFIVTDLNSTNGTYVNRQRIAQATIVREEDRIFIGDFMIRVEVAGDGPASEPATPRRELEAPVPTILPDSDGYSGHHASSPAWDRVSVIDESAARTSSGPPARLTEVPASPVEASNASQRFADMAVGHRRAVHQVIEHIVTRLGTPALEPSDAYSREVMELGSQIVDQLLVDGLIPVGTSAEAVLDQAQAELLDIGPLRELLTDPQVSSISILRFDDVQETRDGRVQSYQPGFSSVTSFERALERLTTKAGVKLEGEVLEGVVLQNGVRLSVLRGSLTPQGPLVVLDKPRRITSSLDDLVRRGAISRAMATFLGHAVQARLNLLVVGPREEGAHVVLGALAHAARERLVVASDFDDFLDDSQAVRLESASLVGRERDALAFVSTLPGARLLTTLNRPSFTAALLEKGGGGLSGVLAALDSPHLNRALLRLPADVASQSPGIDLAAATSWVQSAFDVLVEVARLRDGRVRVLRIAEIVLDGSGRLEPSDIFRFTVSRVAAGGAVEGSFTPSGQAPRVLAQLQVHGARLEPSLFSRPPSR